MKKLYLFLLNKVFKMPHSNCQFYDGWIVLEKDGNWLYFDKYRKKEFVSVFQNYRSKYHSEGSTVLKVIGNALDITKNLN